MASVIYWSPNIFNGWIFLFPFIQTDREESLLRGNPLQGENKNSSFGISFELHKTIPSSLVLQISDRGPIQPWLRSSSYHELYDSSLGSCNHSARLLQLYYDLQAEAADDPPFHIAQRLHRYGTC